MTRPNFCLRNRGHAAFVQENAPFRCTSTIWSHSLSDMFLKLNKENTMRTENNGSFGVDHPLSLKIPALLIRIVTVPNASMAVLMTAAPSETEELFTTAFPPAEKIQIQRASGKIVNMHNGQTFDNLIDNFLGGGSVEVIHHHISPSRREQQ